MYPISLYKNQQQKNLNQNFLLELDSQQNVEKYARVTLLNKKELPIEQIEGRITSSGSVNIDGNSAIRRSCSLTMVSESTNYHEHYWTLKSKFKLEVGIKNTINPNYPEIIWFPQGIYVFTSFSPSYSVNNFTISLQGKDKGCLINGEISGSFNSSVDLGTIENIDEDGVSTIDRLEIKDILINLMHQYAGEPFRNIIINDLEEYGLELLEYRLEKDLFLYREEDSPIYTNMFFSDNAPEFKDSTGNTVDFKKEVSGLETLVEGLEQTSDPQIFTEVSSGTKCYIAKVSYGQTAGYRKTNLVYPGELVAKVGDTIVSILDKIKSMLGQFEYFYDVEGRFVFQKKRYFVNSPIDSNTNEENMLPLQENIAYTFKDFAMSQSFNNNPNLANLKNDFSIWGERKALSGASVPIHLRYSLDEKPKQYTTIEVEDEALNDYNSKYKATLKGQKSITYIASDTYSVDEDKKTVYCDWREVIYQMALDHFKYGFLDDFEIRIMIANGELYPAGITEYEQYYIDLLGFWRQLYYPDASDLQAKIKNYKNKKTQLEAALNASTGSEYDQITQQLGEIETKLKVAELELQDWENNYDSNHWNKNKDIAPETLNFWFDFLDTEGQVAQYGIKKIGLRTKTINDSSIKAIYFRKTPEVIFVPDQEEVSELYGYRYLQVNADNMFAPSSQGKSAKEELDTLLQNHLFTVDNITLQTKPIYYLEPNSKIRINDTKTNTFGDYIISKLTLPLTYNGMMSITASKAVKNIF